MNDTDKTLLAEFCIDGIAKRMGRSVLETATDLLAMVEAGTIIPGKGTPQETAAALWRLIEAHESV